MVKTEHKTHFCSVVIISVLCITVIRCNDEEFDTNGGGIQSTLPENREYDFDDFVSRSKSSVQGLKPLSENLEDLINVRTVQRTEKSELTENDEIRQRDLDYSKVNEKLDTFDLSDSSLKDRKNFESSPFSDVTDGTKLKWARVVDERDTQKDDKEQDLNPDSSWNTRVSKTSAFIPADFKNSKRTSKLQLRTGARIAPSTSIVSGSENSEEREDNQNTETKQVYSNTLSQSGNQDRNVPSREVDPENSKNKEADIDIDNIDLSNDLIESLRDDILDEDSVSDDGGESQNTNEDASDEAFDDLEFDLLSSLSNDIKKDDSKQESLESDSDDFDLKLSESFLDNLKTNLKESSDQSANAVSAEDGSNDDETYDRDSDEISVLTHGESIESTYRFAKQDEADSILGFDDSELKSMVEQLGSSALQASLPQNTKIDEKEGYSSANQEKANIVSDIMDATEGGQLDSDASSSSKLKQGTNTGENDDKFEDEEVSSSEEDYIKEKDLNEKFAVLLDAVDKDESAAIEVTSNEDPDDADSERPEKEKSKVETKLASSQKVKVNTDQNESNNMVLLTPPTTKSMKTDDLSKKNHSVDIEDGSTTLPQQANSKENVNKNLQLHTNVSKDSQKPTTENTHALEKSILSNEKATGVKPEFIVLSIKKRASGEINDTSAERSLSLPPANDDRVDMAVIVTDPNIINQPENASVSVDISSITTDGQTGEETTVVATESTSTTDDQNFRVSTTSTSPQRGVTTEAQDTQQPETTITTQTQQQQTTTTTQVQTQTTSTVQVQQQSTEAETTTTSTQPPPTTTSSPCDSLSCQNNASCENIPGTNDFRCICTSNLFTGRSCENEVDPCVAFPCPINSVCTSDSSSRYCNCTGDFKGENCSETDVLVSCKGDLSVQNLVLENSTVVCFPTKATTSSDHCHDPDDDIVFVMEDNVSGVFSLKKSSAYVCLIANAMKVRNETNCVNISVYEMDDITTRPYRKSSFEVCVTFNEPPSIRPVLPFKYNLFGRVDGDKIFTAMVDDGFGNGTQIWTRIDTSPRAYANNFRMRDTGTLEFVSKPIIPLSGQNVTFSIEVYDGGLPPLKDIIEVRVFMLDWQLTCNVTELIHVQLPHNTAKPVTKIECQTNSTEPLSYTVTKSNSLEVDIDSRGTILLPQIVQTPLIPGEYNVTVEISAGSVATSMVHTTIVLGDFAPVCRSMPQPIRVAEDAMTDTCFEVYNCTNPNGGNWTCNINFTHPHVNSFLLTDCFEDNSTNVVVKFCVFPSLLGNSLVGSHTLEGHIYNNYGSRDLSANVEVINYDEPPRFTMSAHTVAIIETTPIGTIIMQLTADDPDPNDRLTYLINDTTIPFRVDSAGGSVSTSADFNATRQSMYSFYVIVQDTAGLQDFTYFVVDVTDVNEPPICEHSSGTYVITINVTLAAGQVIGKLSCYDTDVKSEYKAFQYDFENTTPQDIKDIFSVNSDGEISLLKDGPTYLSRYDFTILAKDSDGMSTTNDIAVVVNRNFPPVCRSATFQHSLSERVAPGSCYMVPTDCTDPLGGNLFYSATGNNGTRIFNIPETNNGSFIVCANGNLKGEYGKWLIDVLVNNTLAVTKFVLEVTVTDENDLPAFTSSSYNFTIEEKQPINSVVGQVQASDPDSSVYEISSFNIVGGPVPFSIDSLGAITTTSVLNASIVKEYQFVVEVVDKGGLAAPTNVTVRVLDINDPPVCENTNIRVDINLTVSAGQNVGQLLCRDVDRDDQFTQIIYSVQDTENIFNVRADGTIYVENPVPRRLNVYTFFVTVKDNWMQQTGVSVGETTVTVVVNVDRNIPPVCSETSVRGQFLETDPVETCIGKEVICEDPTGGVITLDTPTGSGVEFMKVKERSSIPSEQPFNLCIKSSIKNKIGTFTVSVRAYTDLGSTTVSFAFSIDDVNEPPSFLNGPYQKSISEKIATGQSIFTLTVVDQDVETAFRDFNISGSLRGSNVNSNIQLIGNTFFTVNALNATVKDVYEFDLLATDGGGLTGRSNIVFNITDVNEAPICRPTVYQFSTSILAAVGTSLGKINCFDTDNEPDNRKLTFTSSSDNLSVSSDGQFSIAKVLSRLQTTHTLQVVVSDAGTPPLTTSVSVTVNANNSIPVTCQPNVTYPSIWVVGQCVTIEMNCVDPTLTDTSHLAFSLAGNYGSGFSANNIAKGSYRFCYTLTTSGNYNVVVTVDNQLSPYSKTFSLDVVYQQSTPQFRNTPYSTTVGENVAQGSSVFQVLAQTSGSGNIKYSITGGSNGYFVIEEDTGVIKSNKNDLRDLTLQTATITIQAMNSFSRLKSTAQLTITVNDVNDPPVCGFSNGFEARRVDTKIYRPVGSLMENITCTDPDLDPTFKNLSYSLQVTPNTKQYFGLEDTSDDNAKSIKIFQPLGVTQNQYTVVVTVTDGGGETKRLTLTVDVDLLPPEPTLRAFAINSSTIEVAWSYERPDYYNVTEKFIITSVSPGEVNSFTAPSDRAHSRSMILYLDAETTYDIGLLAVTNYGNISAQSVRVETPAVPVLSTFVVSMKMTGETFSSRLYDNGSFAYVTLSERVKSNIKFVLLRTAGFVDVDILSFRPGSVIVDSLVTVNQTGNTGRTVNVLRSTVSTGWIGNMSVNPSYFLSGNGGGYIRIASLTSNSTSPTVNGSYVRLFCEVEVVGSTGPLFVEWSLNGNRIRPPPTSRFVLGETSTSTSFQRIFTLSILPIMIRDTGTFTCRVNDTTGLYATSSLDVDVVSQPEILVSPLTKSVPEGGSASIYCVVIRPLAYNVTFEWSVDSKVLTGTEANTEKQSMGRHQEQLTLRNLSTRSVVQCRASNIAGNSKKITAVVNVMKATSRSCAAATDAKGTMWDVTVEGSYDIKNCTMGFEGNAVRVCTKGGVWGAPDYSQCRRIDFVLIYEETQHLRDGIQNKTSEDLLGDLARLTEDDLELNEADLDITVDTLNLCASIAEDDDAQVTDSSLDYFLQSASNLLNESNILRWEQMLIKEMKGASRLMRAVSDYGKVSSRRTPLRYIKQKNLVAQLGVTTPKDLTFPEQIPSWLEAGSISKVVISKATIEGLGGSQSVGFSATYYRNMSDLLHKYLYVNGKVENISSTYDVNSAVLDVTFDRPSTSLNPPLRLELRHFSTNYSRPVCGFWDFSVSGTPNGAWSTRGCTVVSSTDTQTICECDHTTNFAVLMSPGNTPETHAIALSIISAVGCGVSFVFLLITIIVYGMYWRYVKSDRSIILMNLCVALIIAYVIFLAGINRTEIKEACTAIAAMLHYILLVVFFLMLAEGIEMAISILYVFSTRSRIHWLMPLSWVLPAIVVAISLGVTQLEGYGNDTFCWLSLDDGLLYAFIGPALAVILTNFIILFLVLRAMFSTHTMLTKSSKEQAKSGLRSMCVILPVIGVTWVLGVFSVNDETIIFQYLFAIFNSFQGLFIFLFHCLFNRQIKDAIRHSRRRKRSLAEFQTKSTSQVSQKGPRKDNIDRIQNDIDQEKDKKSNPLWEADKEVKQMVDKIKQGEINNAFDGKETEKVGEKDNIINIEDVKISNIIKESNGAPESSYPREGSYSNSSRDRSMDSSRERSVDSSRQSRSDGSRDKYEQLNPRERGHTNLAYRDSSSQYTPLLHQQLPEAQGSSQRSSSSGDTRPKYPLGQKLSSTSSNARTSTGTGSTYVDIYSPSPSGSSHGYIQPTGGGMRQTGKISRSIDDLEKRVEQHRTRLDRVYSFSDKPRQQNHQYQSRDYDGPRAQRQFSSKPRQRGNEHDKSRKEVIFKGKVKDAAAARKQQSRKEDKKSRDRSKSHDRSHKYAVGYYAGPGIPQHGSLENVSMQYLGYQPFGGIRGQGQMPQPDMWEYQVPWQEPRQDYW